MTTLKTTAEEREETMVTLKAPVSYSNSTVCGCKWGKELWKQLRFDYAELRQHNHMIEAIVGERGTSKSEDLHLLVPRQEADEPIEDCGKERVRFVLDVGDATSLPRLRHGRVSRVTAEKIDGKWFWVFEAIVVRKGQPCRAR